MVARLHHINKRSAQPSNYGNTSPILWMYPESRRPYFRPVVEAPLHHRISSDRANVPPAIVPCKPHATLSSLTLSIPIKADCPNQSATVHNSHRHPITSPH